MIDVPETQYAKSGDAYVAYQVVGEGDVDLLFAYGIPLSFADLWDREEPARFLASLASFSRLILFDRRGIGLSDPVSPATPPTVEQWMDDALAVLDAAGSTQAAILGSDVVGSHVALPWSDASRPDLPPRPLQWHGGRFASRPDARTNRRGLGNRERSHGCAEQDR